MGVTNVMATRAFPIQLSFQPTPPPLDSWLLYKRLTRVKRIYYVERNNVPPWWWQNFCHRKLVDFPAPVGETWNKVGLSHAARQLPTDAGYT